MENKRPNIVMIIPDTYRGDVLGHLGNEGAHTPNLDSLKKHDAITFSNAYCQCPVCTPSRCSFMTGWYPHVAGHRSMRHMLQPHEPNLLRELKEFGYFIWWGGKNDLVPAQLGYEPYCHVKYVAPHSKERPLRRDLHNYDTWRGNRDEDTFYSFYYGKIENDSGKDYVYDSDWAMVEGALDFINRWSSDQPFCLLLTIEFPHPPYACEDPWYSLIDRDKVPRRISTPSNWDNKPSILKGIYDNQGLQNWSEERFLELKSTYYAMCARVDEQVGMIVDALQAKGFYDETAVFFFSDHGDFTGDYGLVEKVVNCMQDDLTRVPLIIKPPRWLHPKGHANSALVELIDIRATVEELTGLPKTYTHYGRSLLPLFQGTRTVWRDAVFCEGGRNPGESHVAGDVPDDHLYWPKCSLQVKDGPHNTKAVMCRTTSHKYIYRLEEKDELYDMKEDPEELTNQVDNPNYQGIAKELRRRILYFMVKTCDVVPWKKDARGDGSYLRI